MTPDEIRRTVGVLTILSAAAFSISLGCLVLMFRAMGDIFALADKVQTLEIQMKIAQKKLRKLEKREEIHESVFGPL